MSLHKQVHIDIAGFKPTVIYYNLKLKQTMASHHSFSFLWRYSDSVTPLADDSVRMMRDYLNRDIIFTFTSPSGVVVKSKGYILSVKSIDKQGSSAGLIVKGISHTKYIDDMPKTRTFLDKNLQDIVKKIVPEGPGDFYQSGDIVPTYSQAIAYSAQYNETNFEYLKRLATRYGQWFYWDGMRLQFGLTKSSTVRVVTGSSVHDFGVAPLFSSHKIALSGYDYTTATILEAAATKTSDGSGNGISAYIAQKQNNFSAVDASLSAYTNQANNQGELNHMVKLHTASQDTTSVLYTGISYEPLALGKTFTLLDQKIEYKLIAISVIHLSDDNGNYKCKFKAIPSDVKAPPYTNPQVYAKAKSTTARVIANDDPEQMARVKVAFHLKRSTIESDWIRLSNAAAGAGYGLHFVPEIGDEVTINFEGDNAEKPFVLSVNYNGNAKTEYGTPGNDLKAIHTRSGIKMIFNDADQSILLQVPSGGTALLDGNGCITLTAPNDITINAGKSINLNAGTNINTSAGLNYTETVGATKNSIVVGNSMLNVIGKMDILVTGDYNSHTDKERNETATKGHNIQSTEANVHVKTAKELNKHSGEKSKSS